jgi:hypothetical protein
MIGPAGFMAAPKARPIREPVFCKCTRCRHTHADADRIKQAANIYGSRGDHQVCPNCGARAYYQITEAEHVEAEAKRARKAAKRAAQLKGEGSEG